LRSLAQRMALLLEFFHEARKKSLGSVKETMGNSSQKKNKERGEREKKKKTTDRGRIYLIDGPSLNGLQRFFL